MVLSERFNRAHYLYPQVVEEFPQAKTALCTAALRCKERKESANPKEQEKVDSPRLPLVAQTLDIALSPKGTVQ